MKVLIDDGLSSQGELSGIGHHTIQLWQYLRSIIDCDISDYSFLKNIPRVARRISYIGIANVKVLHQKYDIIHYQNHYAPVFKGISKKVITIHDLVSFMFPDTLPTIYRWYNQHAISSAIKHCDAVLTRSSTIKEEVITRFQIPDDKVFVCQGGLREVFFQKIPNEKTVRKFGIEPYNYFLFVGDLSRRKNLAMILSTFLKAKANNLISIKTQLVLIGKFSWGSWDFKHLLSDESGIITLGYLSDEELVSFYKYCKAVVYPSIYEGYGLPLLEAMSQQSPLIVSNIPSSNEINKVHNDQMLIFNLDKEEELMTYLTKTDKDFFVMRQNLNYGKIEQYKYRNVAKHHVQVYNLILNH